MKQPNLNDTFDAFEKAFENMQAAMRLFYDNKIAISHYTRYNTLLDTVITPLNVDKANLITLDFDEQKVLKDHIDICASRKQNLSAHDKMIVMGFIHERMGKLRKAHEEFLCASADLTRCLNLNPSLIKNDLCAAFFVRIGNPGPSYRDNNVAMLRLAKGKKKSIENLGFYKTLSEVCKKNKHEYRVFSKSTPFSLERNLKALRHACLTIAQSQRGEMKHHYRVDVQNNSKKVISQNWADSDPSIVETCNIMADDEKSALDWMAATETHRLYTDKNISQKFYQIVQSEYKLSI